MDAVHKNGRQRSYIHVPTVIAFYGKRYLLRCDIITARYLSRY